ncbi:putative bifunctional diguanylate cyclase/phosphodiesterase [Nannocystaceae bacterium ST9]
MTLDAGGTQRSGSPARSPGRVRVSSVVTATNLHAVQLGSELVVTGEDLSGEVTGLLAAMQPRVSVNYVTREELFGLREQWGQSNEGAESGAEMIFAAVDRLDADALAWLAQIVATMRTPLLVIVDAPAAERSSLRRAAQEAGACDCLLRSELSTPLLEAAVSHARNLGSYDARLNELRERFSLAIRGSKDGMWEWDLVRQRVFYSQRWRELLALEGETIRPTIDSWLSRVHPQDAERLRSDLDNHLKGLTPLHENEHRIRDGAGQWRWVMSRSVIHRNAAGKVVRMAGSLTDITPYRLREQELRQQARHDAATNLPDRRVFHEHLARAVELARAHDDFIFVVLVVEVDRLAQFRDSFGVSVADELIVAVAKRLRGCLRPEDHLFRFGPEQLAILLEDIDDASHGTHIADRIHDVVAEPLELAGQTTFTTVSIGMTSSAHGYTHVDELVADVSAAVDTARDRGRNRHEMYDTSMRIESRTLLALEMAMRKALDREQFELHYQPIVRLADRQVLGFEALMRWNHPERGSVSPSEFIPIAEDTGLIIPLGRWAIREAVRRLHGWQEEFDLRGQLSVSVNLSTKQVGDPLLLETIDSVLAETRIEPRCLKLELTESVMIDQVEQVAALLQELRTRGVEVWIDDFGTGFSSLGYLHRFPVDGLKIDRAFIEGLDGTPQSATMVKTILGLADNLGLAVVAEAIETEEQAAQLEALGCTMCQGWLFGRAVDRRGVATILHWR